jgi:hypothetical protein
MKSSLLALTVVLGLSVATQAATIWTNPITGTDPNTADPYTAGQTVDSNLSTSGIGRGAGITGNNANNRYSAKGWNTPSIDTTAYFTFTLTPHTGFVIDLTSFTYTGQAGNNGNGPVDFDFRSSLDGFAANIGSPNATGTTISLPASQFQDVSTPIEFRFYGFGANKSGGTFAIDDFSFAGTVVSAPTVPESFPGLAGLACVVVGLALARYFGSTGPKRAQLRS